MVSDNITKESIEFIKRNKRLLIDRFIVDIGCESVKNPITIFMAGSPGAGKTEFSKRFIKNQLKKPCVRIDADDIRELIPGYNGKNSDQVHSAACVGVEKLYDNVLKFNHDTVVDGTLSSYEVAKKNIERAIKKDRKIYIFYVYQEPLTTWSFAKAREKLEGRTISKEVFVKDFFKAKENVKRLKDVFNSKLELYLIEKDFQHNVVKFQVDVDIDNFIHIPYNQESLANKLSDSV